MLIENPNDLIFFLRDSLFYMIIVILVQVLFHFIMNRINKREIKEINDRYISYLFHFYLYKSDLDSKHLRLLLNHIDCYDHIMKDFEICDKNEIRDKLKQYIKKREEENSV